MILAHIWLEILKKSLASNAVVISALSRQLFAYNRFSLDWWLYFDDFILSFRTEVSRQWLFQNPDIDKLT